MYGKKNTNFSIIIPTYNRDWCIERAIRSVLQQEFKDWELIIVDDGSTDDTKDIVVKYLSDPRIKYFYKENGGVGSARNIGIKHATNEAIMFLDSDDELISGALSLIYSAILKYTDSKIFSFRAINENGQKISYTDKINDDLLINFTDFISQKYIKGEAFFVFKKNIFYKNIFDENINGGEGVLLFGLIKENGLMIINTNVRIYHTESVDSLISSRLTNEKMQNICKIQRKLIEKYGNDLRKNNKKYLGTTYLVLARALALSNKKISSIKCFMLGYYYNPLDAKRIFLYVISLFDYKLKVNNILNSFYSRYFL